jgi:LacI family transcriptional regulator
MVALGVHRALGDLDLKIGRDISVVSHDDVLSYIGNGGERPLFTATRSSVRAAGRRCAELLLARIKDPNSACVQEVWDVALHMGQSTGAALPGQRRRASAGHRA